MRIFCDDLKPSKVGQGDLVFDVQSGFIRRSEHARDYKFLCAAVAIWGTLVVVFTF